MEDMKEEECPVHSTFGFCEFSPCPEALRIKGEEDAKKGLVATGMFDRLDKEVREQIWEYVLVPAGRLVLSIEGKTMRLREGVQRKNFLAIMTVCKAIGKETKDLVSAHNLPHLFALD